MKKYQKINIKNLIHRLNIKNSKIFNFLFVFFIFNILYLIFFASSVSASPVYPISELGSCRDEKECKLYCDIPQNTPACWSYDKYVINQNILGEETVNITYPISELGNCTSASECFIFCNQPQNQTTCYDFAKARGLIKEKPKLENIIELAKKELGCTNDLECMVFCQQPDNMDSCRDFAHKYGLVDESSEQEQKRPPPAVMQKAKKVLGCSNEGECMNFCNNPENREICFEFAKGNDLLSEEEIEMHEEFREKEKKLFEDSKSELGCETPETCRPICEKPENRLKCETLARKHGMGPPIPPQQFQGPLNQQNTPQQGSIPQGPPNNQDQQNNFQGTRPQQFPSVGGPGGCANEKECKEYCGKNPNDCKGFTQSNNPNLQPPPASGNLNPNNPPNIPGNNPPTQKSGIGNSNSKEGDYLGPGGCKTEKECKAYCEKHPGDCPGFPNPQKQENKLTNPQTSSSSPNTKTMKQQKPETGKQQVKPVSNNIFIPPNGPRPPEMNGDNPPPLPLLTLPPLEP